MGFVAFSEEISSACPWGASELRGGPVYIALTPIGTASTRMIKTAVNTIFNPIHRVSFRVKKTKEIIQMLEANSRLLGRVVYMTIYSYGL